MKTHRWILHGIVLFCLGRGTGLVVAGAFQQFETVVVEPADLLNRADLIGREVIVDDRLRYFQFHPGEGYDEIALKGSAVNFRLPRELRPQAAPNNPAIQIRGVLRREGEFMVCDVVSFQLFPSDTDRLDQAVKRLAPNDYKSRKTWVDWALRRAKSYNDQALAEHARRVEADVFRIESESLRGGTDQAARWRALAEQARERKVPEPEPSALAHKAYRLSLTEALSSKQIDDLIGAFDRFFPKSKEGTDQASAHLDRWRDEYTKDPVGTYRRAAPEIRSAFDQLLRSDLLEKRFRIAAQENPASALDLAAQAKTQLPKREKLAAELLEPGIREVLQQIPRLRLAEIKRFAGLIRGTFERPEEADRLLKEWLKVQRAKLSEADADGRLSLASLYEEMVQDRKSALDLIREAWRTDPGSAEVAHAFRSRGFRRVGDDWVETVAGKAASEPTMAEESRLSEKPSKSSGLRGLSPEEVRQKLGNEPDRIVFSGTKGRLIEQWIYVDPRLTRYVNFLHLPNELKSRVISDYSLPRTRRGGRPEPSR